MEAGFGPDFFWGEVVEGEGLFDADQEQVQERELPPDFDDVAGFEVGVSASEQHGSAETPGPAAADQVDAVRVETADVFGRQNGPREREILAPGDNRIANIPAHEHGQLLLLLHLRAVGHVHGRRRGAPLLFGLTTAEQRGEQKDQRRSMHSPI